MTEKFLMALAELAELMLIEFDDEPTSTVKSTKVSDWTASPLTPKRVTELQLLELE